MQTFDEVAARFGLALDQPWSGVDAVLPVLDAMRGEGAVVVIKMDGERGPDDGGQFTVIVSGGPLAPSWVRSDGHILEDCLRKVIVGYASTVWTTGVK